MGRQLKFVVDDALAERFKRAVLAKHGKLALSKEGAEALRLYLEQAGAATGEPSTERDPLLDAVGSATSKGRRRPDALRDKRALHGG